MTTTADVTLKWEAASFDGIHTSYRAKLGQLGELVVHSSDDGREWRLAVLGYARNNKAYPSAEDAMANAERLARRYVLEANKLLGI